MEFLHDMGEGEEEEEEEEDEEDLPPSQEAVAEDEGPELIPDVGDGSADGRARCRNHWAGCGR